MSKDDVMKRHGATEQEWPSLRQTWPPATVAMKVDEEPPADDGEGDFTSSPQAPSSTDLTDESAEQPAPITPQEALRQAEAALDARRHELRVATDTLASARANVAKRLAEYNRGAPTITAEQNTRDWIAANNAARAERAAARGNFIPSVTETARAMGGGGHGDDIRTRRGGGAAYRRGPGGVQAYTKNQAQTLEANRIRAERAKLPSER